MTLKAKIGVLWIFWQFRAVRHILRANCIKISRDRHGHVKFSALNVDFDDPSLDLLVQGNLRTRTSNSDTPVKVVILLLLASLL